MMRRVGSLAVLLVSFVACTGGGGPVGLLGASWEPAGSSREAAGGMERANGSQEGAGSSREGGPAGGGGAFACAGTYLCREANDDDTEVFVLQPSGAGCSFRVGRTVVTVNPDGTATANGRVVGTYVASGTNVQIVLGDDDDVIVCTKVADGVELPDEPDDGEGSSPPPAPPRETAPGIPGPTVDAGSAPDDG